MTTIRAHALLDAHQAALRAESVVAARTSRGTRTPAETRALLAASDVVIATHRALIDAGLVPEGK